MQKIGNIAERTQLIGAALSRAIAERVINKYLVVVNDGSIVDALWGAGISAVKVEPDRDPADIEKFIGELDQFNSRINYSLISMLSKKESNYLYSALDQMDPAQGYIKGGWKLSGKITQDTDPDKVLKIFTDFITPRQSGTGTRQAKEALSIANLMEWLDAHNLKIRKNTIKRTVEFSGDLPALSMENREKNIRTFIFDKVKADYSCQRSTFDEDIDYIADQNRYNPFLEILDSLPEWDGEDRIEELYSALHISTVDTLSRILIIKFLRQVIMMARNEFGLYGADGVLMLVGAQGIGKSTFARYLSLANQGSKYAYKSLFYESADLQSDKDKIAEISAYLIAEIGEADKILKRVDDAWLKGYITATRDVYRAPYERIATEHPRLTSMIGTCNPDQFLKDTTGNRRFWTVPIDAIDLHALTNIDYLKLWAQVKADIDQYSGEAQQRAFRLTREEQSLLAKRNSRHLDKLPAQQEVEDILAKAEQHPTHYFEKTLTATEFKEEYFDALSRYSAIVIGKALQQVLPDDKIKKGRARTVCYIVPAYRSRANYG